MAVVEAPILSPVLSDPINEASGPLVLIVDDSLVDRRLAAALLVANLDARTLEAEDGCEALEILQRENPALVLTDMQMPRMNGLQLVEEARVRYPRMPVVLMTAYGSEELAMNALRSGAASYVPKRILCAELISTVESVLAAARQNYRRDRIAECLTTLECGYQLENDSALVPDFIAQMQDHMRRVKFGDEHSKIRIGVALEEALLNGMFHGNLELSSDLRQDGSNLFNEMAQQRRVQSPFCDRRLHVQVRISSREARFIIRDEGPGFDVSNVPDPTDPENLVRASGRGLLLIRAFMDEVSHNADGNQITLIKRSESN